MITGLCLSDPHPDYISDGSATRTLSATRFAGRYRVVDFMLSNMVNSGIVNIGMILNSHYQSLTDHIGTGKEWDLARKSGGVKYFPPYLTDERQSVNNEMDGPLYRAAQALADSRTQYIVLADSGIVYNMDYRRAIETHIDTGADVTAVYTKKIVGADTTQNTAAFRISEDNRITSIRAAKAVATQQDVSLGVYVMQKSVFLQLISGEKNCGMLRFSKEILASSLRRLKVMPYEYTGYSARICSVDTFFRYNMDMLDTEKRKALFQVEGRRIYTSRHDTLPTKYGRDAEIKNCIIADGCQIEGTVINSVICRNVRVGPGAIVKNCIIQSGTIEKDAQLEWIVADRGIFISEGRKLISTDTYPMYIGRNQII